LLFLIILGYKYDISLSTIGQIRLCICGRVCTLYKTFIIPRNLSWASSQRFKNFGQYYVNDPLGCFITVKDKNRIIGTIAYRAYDHRFDLNLPSNTVEVVKLFVLPEYRRNGIATQLCDMLFSHAKTMKLRLCICTLIHFCQRLKSFGVYKALMSLTVSGSRPMTPFT
jgi:ribosomal protein S18 acetylase RimI-like enzyme